MDTDQLTHYIVEFRVVRRLLHRFDIQPHPVDPLKNAIGVKEQNTQAAWIDIVFDACSRLIFERRCSGTGTIPEAKLQADANGISTHRNLVQSIVDIRRVAACHRHSEQPKEAAHHRGEVFHMPMYPNLFHVLSSYLSCPSTNTNLQELMRIEVLIQRLLLSRKKVKLYSS